MQWRWGATGCEIAGQNGERLPSGPVKESGNLKLSNYKANE
jgi:hypothetical protein